MFASLASYLHANEIGLYNADGDDNGREGLIVAGPGPRRVLGMG